jgi:hypothetical protein
MNAEPTPIRDMPTAQILELIELLERSAYQELSHVHDEQLEDLKRELRIRNTRL